METPTFSAPNLRNISKNLNFRHNSTTNGDDFKELTLIQALRTPALVGTLFLFSLIIFSIVGNALVCRTIFVTRRLHNPGYYFVASLAVADFLVGIFPLPLLLLFHITLEMKGKWIFGVSLCNANILATVWFCCASIFSLCGVTWDRYVAVTSPLRYTSRMTNSRVTCIIVTIWVTSFVVGMLNSYPIITRPGRILCEIYKLPLVYSVLDFMFLWFLPITFVVFVNGKIWKAASRQIRRIQAQIPGESFRYHSNSQDLTNDVTNGNQESQPRQATKNSTRMDRKMTGRNHSVPCTEDQRKRIFYLKKEIKTFRTFLIVIGCFFFTWTPFFFILVIESFTPVSPMFVYLCGMFTYVNSAYNPLIYGIFNRDFRKALFDSFKKRSQGTTRIKHVGKNKIQVSPNPPTVPQPPSP